MDPVKLVVAVLALAALVEWVAERFFGQWVKGEKMIYVTAVLGVGACLLFRLDGLALLGLPDPLWSPYSGQVITGLIVSAGSAYAHKLLKPTPIPEPPVTLITRGDVSVTTNPPLPPTAPHD